MKRAAGLLLAWGMLCSVGALPETPEKVATPDSPRPQRTLITSAERARSREDVESVFDRNKGALFALYGRALRDNPNLQGEFRFRLRIASSGAVTDCTVLSSELKEPGLEAKLCARLKLLQFGPRSDSTSVEKSLEFFPAR